MGALDHGADNSAVVGQVAVAVHAELFQDGLVRDDDVHGLVLGNLHPGGSGVVVEVQSGTGSYGGITGRIFHHAEDVLGGGQGVTGGDVDSEFGVAGLVNAGDGVGHSGADRGVHLRRGGVVRQRGGQGIGDQGVDLGFGDGVEDHSTGSAGLVDFHQGANLDQVHGIGFADFGQRVNAFDLELRSHFDSSLLTFYNRKKH